LKADFNFPHKEMALDFINFCNKEKTGCVLAGGYLRDIVLDKPYKDLDFFLHVRTESPYLFEEGILEFLKFDYDKDTVKDSGEMYGGNFNLKVEKDGITYNFIQIYMEPSNYVQRNFDYSINQIFFDGSLKKSRAFLDTLKSKQVKAIMNTQNVERLNYLKSKFPDYVFPEIEVFKESDYMLSLAKKAIKRPGASYEATVTLSQTALNNMLQAQAEQMQLYNQVYNQVVANPPAPPTTPTTNQQGTMTYTGVGEYLFNWGTTHNP
jgi:hypothetical protein